MFKERSWNNPVVRFIKADKSDIITKITYNPKTKSLSTKNLVHTMIAALKAEKKAVPLYLELLDKDLQGFSSPENLEALSKSIYKHLPLGFAQSKAVNEALEKKEDPEKLLSPSQLTFLKAVQKDPSKEWPVFTGRELIEAWTDFAKFYKLEVEAI